MGISREHLTTVLRNAQASDNVLLELKKVVESAGYGNFMNEASKIALAVGNIRLKESNDEGSTCAYMVDAFKAALYQQCVQAGVSYAANNPTVHNELLSKWGLVQQYVTTKQHLLNAATTTTSLGGGLGSGVSVSLSPSAPAENAGVAVSLGAAIPGGLPGTSGSLGEAVPAVSDAVVNLLQQGTSKPAAIATPAPAAVAVVVPPTRRKDVDYLTGDHMESFKEHNLMELESVAMAPAALNRSVAQFREKGSYTEDLVKNLMAKGVHKYSDGNIMVTMEDRARSYYMGSDGLKFLRDAGDAHQKLLLRELERARNSDDVDIVYDALSNAVQSCKALIDDTVRIGKERLADGSVSVVEMSVVQTFIRKFCELLDLRVGRAIAIMTVSGSQVPTCEGRTVRWDGNMADVTFLMTQIYDKAAGENGVVEDGDSFRLIFIAILQALCTIDQDWSDTGVTVHNVVATIWLPANYPLDKSDSVCNKTMGNVHEPVQAIHDELMRGLPESSVVLAMPGGAKLLCGAGDSTVIYY